MDVQVLNCFRCLKRLFKKIGNQEKGISMSNIKINKKTFTFS